MERVFDGHIYDMVCQNGNIVFTYCKDSIDNAALIGYKMITRDNPVPATVAKNIYLLSKFGSNYRKASELSSNYVFAKTTELPSGVFCVLADTGNAYLVDQSGLPFWSGDLNYKGEKPSDIAAYKNTIWACYKKASVLLRFNLTTMREEIRIGGKKSPFSEPTDIFITDNIATVCNSGSNKLIEVNLDSYVLKYREEFSESVYSFVSFDDKRYVLLESGLYVV